MLQKTVPVADTLNRQGTALTPTTTTILTLSSIPENDGSACIGAVRVSVMYCKDYN
jgi:hypothetical protein